MTRARRPRGDNPTQVIAQAIQARETEQVLATVGLDAAEVARLVRELEHLDGAQIRTLHAALPKLFTLVAGKAGRRAYELLGTDVGSAAKAMFTGKMAVEAGRLAGEGGAGAGAKMLAFVESLNVQVNVNPGA